MNASILCSKSSRDFHNYLSNSRSFQSISNQCLKALVGVIIACSIILIVRFICYLVTCRELCDASDGKILMTSDFRQKWFSVLGFVKSLFFTICGAMLAFHFIVSLNVRMNNKLSLIN